MQMRSPKQRVGKPLANKRLSKVCRAGVRLSRAYLVLVAAAAIFDLDNTLVRGSSLFHFGVHLSRNGVINPVHVLRHLGAELCFEHRGGERENMPANLAGRMLRLVEGRAQSDIRDHATNFASHHLRQHLLASVLAEVMAFQFRGIPVFLATASPQELADAIARELGMTGAVGTVAEVRGGRYTGKLDSPIAHGSQKASRVRALIAEHGWDPRDCWAFTDSVNDLPLLACVGHPIAVNPDRHLKKLAQLNDWQILPGSGAPDRRPRASSKQALP